MQAKHDFETAAADRRSERTERLPRIDHWNMAATRRRAERERLAAFGALVAGLRRALRRPRPAEAH